MKVFNCYHPKIIRNPYSGELITCKCGKCPACLNARVSDWIMRLDLEAQCHKYVVFFTLTYDDLNVPQFIRLRKEDYDTPAYINADTGELLDMLDIKENFTYNDKQYIYKNKVLNVLDKRDFQNFIKRLRYYFDECDKGAKLRYYLCGEYGPTTFRPHGHCLLFFDSAKCAREISVLLHKSWKHGVLYDPHNVSGSAASYCAAYINGVASLPKCYLHKSIKPFTLFSKSPAIGSLNDLIPKAEKIFNEAITTFRRYDKTTNTFKDEFILRSIRNRIFPRCQRFGSLSDVDRVALYRFVERFPKTLTARQIAERIKWEYIDRYNQSAFALYFRDIAYKRKLGYSLHSDKASLKEEYKDYPFLPSDKMEVPFYGTKSVVREFCFDSLVRFARTLKRVRKNAELFHVSIPYYVSKISEFYEKVEKEKLIKDYEFQNEYFKTHPISDFMYFDPSFAKRVNSTDYALLSNADKFYINELKVPLNKDGKYRISYLHSREFWNFKMMHDKISHDLVKQKKTNDYMMTKKNRHGQIINDLNI